MRTGSVVVHHAAVRIIATVSADPYLDRIDLVVEVQPAHRRGTCLRASW